MTGVIVGFLVVGFLLVIAEAFVPGGVLGAIGTVLLIGVVVLSFYEYGAAHGALIFGATALGVFVVLYVGVRMLPQTRMGRKILLSEKVEGTLWGQAEEQQRQSLLGREGEAVSDLRPSGKGMINGKRWDVVSDGGYIAKGAPIRVVRVEGLRIVVSPVGEDSAEQTTLD